MTEKPDLTFLKIHDRWERARRSPKYLAQAEKAIFDENGILDLAKTAEAGSDPNACTECAEAFGLQEMIDPSKEFYELLGFADPPAEDDVSEETEERIDRTIWTVFIPNFDATMSTPDAGMPGPLAMMSPDGNYFAIVIDASRSNEEIIEAVLSRVEEYRHKMNIKVSKGGDTFAKRFNYYQIWDERRKRRPFEEIAISHKKNREEPKEVAIDRVKKQFYRAYELIMGESYDLEKWKRQFFPQGDLPDKHARVKGGTPQGGSINKIYDDPEVALSIEDLKRVCEKCKSDPICRKESLEGLYIEKWSTCSFIFDFLSKNKPNYPYLHIKGI